MLKYRHYADDFAQVLAKAREIVRQAKQLLRDPLPDTFLGRKTQEPPSPGKEDEF